MAFCVGFMMSNKLLASIKDTLLAFVAIMFALCDEKVTGIQTLDIVFVTQIIFAMRLKYYRLSVF